MAYGPTQEITTPEFKKFEAYGDCVEGTLVKSETIIMTDKQTKRRKEVPAFFVLEREGTMVKFLAGMDLAEKLMQVPYRSRVSISYARDQPMSEGKAPMKIFEVKAQRWIEETSDAALEITDDDIPF